MLFYYAYIIYLISMFLTYTMFDYIPTFTIINNGIRYTVVPALLVASLAQNKIQANNTLIILSGIILFLLFNFVFSFDKSTLLVVFIIFIAKDVNYESIITVSLWVTIGMLLFIFGSCTLGLIENRIYVQEFGTRVRYSFEIVDKDVPFLLLMNDGSTRALDSRALDFLNRFQAKTTLIDAKDFGLGSVIPSTVKDYFNPMLITAVLRVYAEQLAILRNHPLTQRRYMWKLEY